MKTNWLAIIVCPIANMLLGMAWYGAFAMPWMQGHGLTQEMMEQTSNPGIAYAVSFGGSFVSAFILNLLFQRLGVKGLVDGVKSGAAVGFFGLMGTIVMFQFAMKPFSLSLIDGGFAFLLFVVYGAILGGWQKKAA